MSDKSRRKLLKSIAAGSGAMVAAKGLPESWSRPVVNSVLLPAHAQTSLAPFYTVLASNTMYQDDNKEMFAGLIDELLPTAAAGTIMQSGTTACGINNGKELNVTGFNMNSNANYSFTSSLPLDGSPADAVLEFCEGGAEPPRQWNIIDIDGSKVTIKDQDGGTIDLFAADKCVDIPECIIFSDRSLKANFAPVDEQEILRKVASMPIETWNYTDREPGVRHIGPMAQDFMASFNVGGSDRHIQMVDANGVNLAAIKALSSKLEEKDAQISKLQEQLADVLKRLDTLS